MYSEGQPLVEVFGVRFLHGGEAPAGTVSVYDGKSGQIIYSGGAVDQPLVEIFGVRLHGGETPAGTISVYDGKRGQIMYSGRAVDKSSSLQTQVRQDMPWLCFA
jgi:hypothetical protein